MGYAPEDVVASAGLTVAMSMFVSSDSYSTARQLAEEYQRAFDDKELQRDFIYCGFALKELIENLHPGTDDPKRLASICLFLTKAIMAFQVDGRRKRRGFLASPFFTSSRYEIQNKPTVATSLVTAYHLALQAGKIDADLVQ